MMTVQESIALWYRSVMQPTITRIKKFRYIRELLISVVLLPLLIAGFFGYRLYRTHKEQAAHRALATCIAEYEKVAKEEPQMLSRVEMLCKLGYEQHENSALAPYFLAFRANVLMQQDKKEEALAIIDKMLDGMTSASPLFTIYKTKRALMQLDMSDHITQAAGLDELRQLAQDKNNMNNDIALYYVGLYHWAKNEIEESKKVWEELVSTKIDKKESASPWVALAEEKLKQIA